MEEGALNHPLGYQVSDVWDDINRVRHNSKWINAPACQLPVNLVERIIMMTTDENDIVFDPFCGGGSIAVTVRQMGRKYIGSDIDNHYCSVVRNKLNQSKPILEYGCYISIHLRKIVSIRDVDVT